MLAVLPFVAVAAPTENEALTVAVFDFTSNTPQNLPRDTTALIMADLSTNMHFVMVERAQINKALGEQAFGLSGDVNADAAAKVGQLTGAKVLVAGRVIRLNGELVMIANVVGTETSRVFTDKAQGPLAKQLVLTAELSQKIAATIIAQSNNLVGQPGGTRQNLIDGIVEKLKGKHLPTVSLEIRERVTGERGLHETAQNELGIILQKAGFTVLDEKSDMRPEVLITGTAVADGNARNSDMISCQARIELKATARKSGDVIEIDRQDSSSMAVGREVAARRALEEAVDKLCQRFLPKLAQ